MELAADGTLLQILPYLVHGIAPKQAQILDRVPLLFCYLERRQQVIHVSPGGSLRLNHGKLPDLFKPAEKISRQRCKM